MKQLSSSLSANCASLGNQAGPCEYPLFRSATGDEFAQSAALCESRPLPRGYQEMLMRQSVKGKRFVLEVLIFMKFYFFNFHFMTRAKYHFIFNI